VCTHTCAIVITISKINVCKTKINSPLIILTEVTSSKLTVAQGLYNHSLLFKHWISLNSERISQLKAKKNSTVRYFGLQYDIKSEKMARKDTILFLRLLM